jgi:hypothetical protein
MPPATGDPARRPRRIRVTGLSGTGTSTALAALRRRGYETVDTDEPDWGEWSDAHGGRLRHRLEPGPVLRLGTLAP